MSEVLKTTSHRIRHQLAVLLATEKLKFLPVVQPDFDGMPDDLESLRGKHPAFFRSHPAP